jgi:phospholipase C
MPQARAPAPGDSLKKDCPMFRRVLHSSMALAAGLGVCLSCGVALAGDERDHGDHHNTATPIKHVIVLIGENWTFDSIYATYQPKHIPADRRELLRYL